MAAVPTLAEIYEAARATLADVGGDVYTDTVLSPFAKRACHKAARYLRSQGTSIFRKESPNISALAATTKLERSSGVQYPSDMVRPIELREKLAADTEFRALRCQNGFIPSDVAAGSYRQYWDWINDAIVIPAGTATSTIQIQYQAAFPDPVSWITTPASTSIPIPDGLDALSWLTAAYAYASRDERENAKYAYEVGMEDLSTIAAADIGVATAQAARYGRQ